MKQRFFLLALFIYCIGTLPAQVKIGDNPAGINAKSLLELESTTKGLLLPRMTNDQIAAMSGVPKGMLVFSSTDSALYLRRDTGWAILALADTKSAVTNKWATSGPDIYTTNTGKVGIGTSIPYSKLSNTSGNTIGSDGSGGSDGSLAWATMQAGYVGQFYNGLNATNANGLVIKTASSAAVALDVSQGAGQSTPASSLLRVANNRVNMSAATAGTLTVVIGTGNQYDFLMNNGSGAVGSRKGYGALGLTYVICVNGAFPPRDRSSSTDNISSTNPYLGEIMLFAGNYAPTGWAFCNGQLLNINQNNALYAVIGNIYGGNGQTNFALPNLQGAVPVSTGTSPAGYNWNLGNRFN